MKVSLQAAARLHAWVASALAAADAAAHRLHLQRRALPLLLHVEQRLLVLAPLGVQHLGILPPRKVQPERARLRRRVMHVGAPKRLVPGEVRERGFARFADGREDGLAQ